MIGQTISHYRVVAKLGAGGMGAVYRAIDQKLERPVALKFLPSQAVTSDSDRTRFLREARSAAALSHPAICTVHEIDEADDQIFIAMEYIDGQSLAERIAARSLYIDEAVGIAIQIAEGLQEAHEKGFVHRDIKPANIMITKQGRAVILDFGLVRSLEATSVTKVGIVKGTTAYLSPEQVRGQPADQRADIWALGVVLYEMFAGRRPFQGEIDQATIYLILQQEPVPLRKIVPEVPAGLEQVITRALAKDPGARYQHIGDMLDDLRSALQVPDADATPANRSAGLRMPSIAVLPFANLTGDPEREYFCDGMAEELIIAMTRIRGLRVMARTSSFVFKNQSVDVREIGEALGVASVLEGSIRMDGTCLRITTQLIGVTDGCHLWSQRFERELTDIFALQDEISLAIVSYLKPRLARTERTALLKRYTDNIEAHDLHLRARFLAARAAEEDFRNAIKCLEQAIAKDPGFALAYSELATMYAWCSIFDYLPTRAALEKAHVALARALELDDNLAEAHASMGTVGFYPVKDLKSARKELERAEALAPDSAMVYAGWAVYHMVRREYDACIARMEEWERTDPFSVARMVYLVIFLIRAGRLQEARRQISAAFDFAPDFDQLHWLLGEVNIIESKHEEGLASIRRAVELSRNSLAMRAGLAWGLAAAGRAQEARDLLAELIARTKTEYLRSYYLARIHCALGEHDQAFACLEQTYASGDYTYLYMASDWALRNLHSDPRWTECLEKWRVPQ